MRRARLGCGRPGGRPPARRPGCGGSSVNGDAAAVPEVEGGCPHGTAAADPPRCAAATPTQRGPRVPQPDRRPLRRNNFRRRVWLPSLVRAGLLGSVTELNGRYEARWQPRTGKEASALFSTRGEAEGQIASAASGGPRFHDLRHSYATWLVRRVMGHEQASTTFDIYTHAPDDDEARVLAAFGDSAAFSLPSEATEPSEEDEDVETDAA